MKWLLFAIGLLVAFAGSASAAALVTTARVRLADAIARRLRGTRESLAWLAVTERQVAAATAATSFGVGFVGAAIPGIFSHIAPLELAVLVLLVGVPVTLLGGYLLPRWLTLPRAEIAVVRLRPVIRPWTAFLGVVLPTRQPDPDADVQALAREGAATGLGGDQLMMVGGVMTFAERAVREVMTPRTDIVAVPHDVAYPDLEAVFAESGYTRLPVYRSTLDEIVGMIHAFDLFKYRAGDALPLRPLSFAPETRAASDVLLDMQRERQHMTVVVDEFGGTAGIVTLEDLIEALVGEITDEDAPAGPPRSLIHDILETDGALSPAAVADQFNVVLPVGTATSFAGLLTELAGYIPQVGDRFTVAGLDVDVLAASPARVERLLVRRTFPEAVRLDRHLS